jgi:hypothetical protein
MRWGQGCVTAGGHYNPHAKTHGGPKEAERHVSCAPVHCRWSHSAVYVSGLSAVVLNGCGWTNDRWVIWATLRPKRAAPSLSFS